MTAIVAIDEETAVLAEQVARLTGRTLPDVLREAVRAEARRLNFMSEARGDGLGRLLHMLAVTEPFAGLEVRDARSADEILEFDERGAPR